MEKGRREIAEAFIACVAVPIFVAVILHRATAYLAGSDYIQLYAAGRLLARGGSPYDTVGLAAIQGPLLAPDQLHPLFRKQGFMPFLYPPWMALACMPLALLPYVIARPIWIWLIVESLALSAWSASGFVCRPPRAVWVALALGTAPSLYCLKLGQTSPLVLLAAVGSLLCLDARRDRLAGTALAWATIKPQLAIVLIPALLLWTARRRRWGVWFGFAGMLGTLVMVCTLLDRHWPSELLRALMHAPFRGDVAINPGQGTSCPLLLRAAGLQGAILVVSVAILVLTASILTAWEALRREATALDVMGIAVSAAFVVAPYAQAYDFTILLLSAVALAARQTDRSVWIAPLAFYVVPSLNPVLALVGLPLVTISLLPATFMIMIAARSARAPQVEAR